MALQVVAFEVVVAEDPDEGGLERAEGAQGLGLGDVARMHHPLDPRTH